MKIYKTVIIGSGIIGSSIAHHLSQHHSDVLVIDKGFPASGTSGATQAWIWIHTKQPSFYAEFSMFSGELYRSLKKQLGMDFELHRTGGITPIFDEASLKKAEKLVENQREYGIDVTILSREETLRKEPNLNPQLIGATYSPLDGHLNPMRLNSALVESAEKNGVEFQFYTPVTNVEMLAEGGYEITTINGKVFAEQVVIAGGPDSKEIGNLLSIDIPIKPVKGQLMVTEPLQPLLRHLVSGMRQTNNGEIIIGYSKEDSADRTTSFNIIGETARYALKIIPKLEKVNIVRVFAGIRSMPIDGLPILGEVPDKKGLFLAVTHSGVTLAPIVGLLMSELLTNKPCSIPIDKFSVDRFFTEMKKI